MIQGFQRAIKESILLKAFLGVVMISFAVWGVGDAINPTLDPNVVIKVDQVEVRADELQRRFNLEVEELRNALGPDFTAKQAADLGIFDNILFQLSQSASLDMAARDMGILIPDETLRRAVLEQEMFKDETGNFNRLLFNTALANNNLSEQGFVDLLRGDVTRQTMLQPIAENSGAPNTLVDALFRYRAEQRMADVLYVGDASVILEEEPSEQDLRDIYNDNLSSFSAPEYREVSAVVVRPSSLVPPESITQDEIQAFYDENIDRYRTRETRTVNQLVFSTQFEAQAAYDAIEDGDMLTTLAEKVDAGIPIELGTISANDQLGFDLAPIFALDVQTISTPVQSDFGWHLFEVTDRTPDTIKALPVVRQEIVDFIVEDRALDEMYEATVYMEDQLAAGIPVQDVASAPGFSYVYFEAVDRDGRDPYGRRLDFPIEQERFLRLAFSTEERLDSQLIETEEHAYILRVEDVIAPAPKPFDRVSEEAKALWETQTKQALTSAKALALVNEIGPSSDFPALAEEDDLLTMVKLGPVTRFGDSLRLDAIIPARYVSPQAMDKLFRANMGDVIEARVAEGHIVARLIEIVPPSEVDLAEQKDQVEEAVRTSIANDLVAEFTSAVTEGYAVTLNRETLDEITPR